jgi:hypothetical protein
MTRLLDAVLVAAPPELRPYQTEAVAEIEGAYRDGKRAPLLELATGAGKTVVAGEVIRRATAAGRACLFLAPRRELVYQASASLARAGIDHGVFMAGREDLENAWAPVTVASIDTTLVRVLRRGRRPFVDPNLVVVDEAHLSITKRRQDLLNLWPEARLLGLTATPSRKDGRALGILYDTLIEPVIRARPTASFRSLLLICIDSAALAWRASMQITGRPRARSSCQSHVVVGPVSRPMRTAFFAFALMNAAIAAGSEITVPSLTISPFPSTTQIDVSLSDTSSPT